MDVAVAGGHGKIALRLLRLLSQRGDRGLGLIRNVDQASDLEAVGAMPVGADLENLDPDAIATSITGCVSFVNVRVIVPSTLLNGPASPVRGVFDMMFRVIVPV